MVDDHRLTAGGSRPPSADTWRPVGRIVALVWWLGALLLGLIALSAVVSTAQLLKMIWGAGPDRAGLIWIGAAVALAVAAVIGLVVVLILARRGHPVAAASIGVGALVATRAVAIAAIPTPLRTDWAEYHDLAITLADGGAYQSARPPGWPFALSLLYRAAGPNPLIGELANLACAVAIGLLIYLLASRSFGRVAAGAGLFLWAISPGPAIFTAVLASEPLYTLTFIGAIVLAVLAIDRTWLFWVPVGLLLALSHYVRPVGLVVLPAFIVLPFLIGLPRRRAASAAVTVLVVFALALGPSVAWQYQRYGRVSLSTSNFDGWNLLVGLNVAHNGQYNRDDLALVGAANDTVEFRDRSYRLAIARLTADPGSVLVLAAPKFLVMWGDNRYGPVWTMASNRPGHPRITATLTLLSQVAYAVVAILAAASLWIRRRERDPASLLIVMCLESVALSEVFLEVQPRYHAAFEPLFCMFAGITVAWLASRRRPQQAVATTEPMVGEVPGSGVVATFRALETPSTL